jgi:hypothetical protein
MAHRAIDTESPEQGHPLRTVMLVAATLSALLLPVPIAGLVGSSGDGIAYGTRQLAQLR